MEWLNYNHLHYFWVVAREGGIARACTKLHLSQPTISTQIKRLEESMGVKLFQRQGRSLELTDVGRTVFVYADEIFNTGLDLVSALKSELPGKTVPFNIGVSNAVPKLIVCQLLQPLMRKSGFSRLVCREDNTEQLLKDLATHSLDVVLADTPASHHTHVKVFNHVLGRSDTAFFASSALAAKLKRGFPMSLHEKKMVLPTTNTALRSGLDVWFHNQGINPEIVAEFEDPALMKVVGAESDAIFPAPFAIARDICRIYDVSVIGRTDSVKEHYYAISAQRRLTHPGVLAITSAAREKLFK